ncbi:GNAT family N-acetyltransferase [Yoonia sp. SS1-5]|uniref:L-ornithine N(alpha)-acyltransferase n=1 Tax=Yoonia rhodophyticola TaxID=3137370 RepID=A0AAN0M6Y9_9RHOB
MTIPLQQACYRARFATSEADLLACQQLRHLCFFGHPGRDADKFDVDCRHLMVTDVAGHLVATLRLFEAANGAQAAAGYAGQHYDLSGFAQMTRPMIEIGRFCVAPDVMHADVSRTAWAALARLVDAGNVGMLFGCTSLTGTDPARYGQAMQCLIRNHLGPREYLPGIKSSNVTKLSDVPVTGTHPLPPLMRSYLAMGGWVGDHLVTDPRMKTMHVFTCLDVDAVPPARARALRTLAQALALP